jgi:hypothetical protein
VISENNLQDLTDETDQTDLKEYLDKISYDLMANLEVQYIFSSQ